MIELAVSRLPEYRMPPCGKVSAGKLFGCARVIWRTRIKRMPRLWAFFLRDLTAQDPLDALRRL
ncbi:hypothetical protein KCP73_00085 [Salmonella enterica subsp. enterica]|nr:hypothetical protein KCP73_00085 [Salmonella enterica subsp. enterica]